MISKKPSTIDIQNKTKGKLPRLPFVRIKDAILGNVYELSICFVSPRESRRLNRTYRGKDSSTNILSFSLSDTSGELIIDLAKVKKEAPDFSMTYPHFLGFLIIHGMLHLKGFEHSSTMERKEALFKKRFGFVTTTKPKLKRATKKT